MIEIVLPFPPSLNHAWRRVGAKTVLAKAQRDYRKAAVAAVAEAIPSLRERVKLPLQQRLGVSIYLFPPNARKWDIDGKPKAVLDALTKAGVWIDDGQIDWMLVHRMSPDKLLPRAKVRIWTLV